MSLKIYFNKGVDAVDISTFNRFQFKIPLYNFISVENFYNFSKVILI
jgi:hypothetical protein